MNVSALTDRESRSQICKIYPTSSVEADFHPLLQRILSKLALGVAPVKRAQVANGKFHYHTKRLLRPRVESHGAPDQGNHM